MGWLIASVLMLGGPQFSWTAPSECPDEPAVRESVATQLGRPISSMDTAQITIDARVRSTERGWTIELETETAAGQRSRQIDHGGSCAEATEIAALVIAIAIEEAEPAPAPPVADHEPVAEPPVTDAPKPEQPQPTPTPRPAPKSRLQAGLRVDGGASLGDLPGFGGTLGGAATLLRPWLRVELGGRYGFARSRRAAGTNSGADFTLWTLFVRGCGVPSVATVEFPVCLGLEGGVLRAEPVALEGSNIGRSAWGATTVGPMVAWAPLRNFAIVFGVEGVIPFVRREYEVIGAAGPVRLHRPTPVGLRLHLGLEGRFP